LKYEISCGTIRLRQTTGPSAQTASFIEPSSKTDSNQQKTGLLNNHPKKVLKIGNV
jgi:hypothetical protein